MLVSLSSELFEPPTISTAMVMSLVQDVINDRHRLEIETGDPRVAAWIAQQSRDAREEIDLALSASAQSEIREPAATRVVVGRFAHSNFGYFPLQVRLEDAPAFLDRPVRILLEDRVSDARFLSKMLTFEERREFDRRIARGFAQFEHGGGVGSMIRSVGTVKADPAAAIRHWVMFDSDSLFPGIPSAQSEALRLASNGLDHYQLRRRSIENYLPVGALAARAARKRNPIERHVAYRTVDAFSRLSRSQRDHLHMKKGFYGDLVRMDAANVDGLYDGLNAADRAALSNGFGDDVADLFNDEALTESDLRNDSGWTELRPVVRRLLEKMR